MEQQTTERLSEGVKLNLVVCGSDGTLKSSVSERILQQTDVELHDRQISVIELPALFNTQLSEEEVMRQTLRCVSLCHPGVHVFLLILPDAPLNNEDKAEMEEIQRIFSSRINKHIMILIMQDSEHQTAELNEETQSVIERFGGRHQFFGPTTQVSTLMENIEQMLEENRGGFFSTETFLEAQMKKLLQFEEMKKKIHSLETHLLSQVQKRQRVPVNIQDTPVSSLSPMRIMLLGRGGAGKSASGNTILGQKEFRSEISVTAVTRECSAAHAAVSGRSVTVVDTPELTYINTDQSIKEIERSVNLSSPGPHAFLIVFALNKRCPEKEQQIPLQTEMMFGQEVLKYSIILFTYGDLLKGETIEELIEENYGVRRAVQRCGGRFHVFNNRDQSNRKQVTDLLQKIDSMIEQNGGYYSNQMFEDALRFRREEKQRQLCVCS